MSNLTFPLVNNAKLLSAQESVKFTQALTHGDADLAYLLGVKIVEKAVECLPESFFTSSDEPKWGFVQIADDVGFVYPEIDEPITAHGCFETVPVDKISFGIAYTIIAVNHLSWQIHDNHVEQSRLLDSLFFKLRDWLYCDATEMALQEAVGKENAQALYNKIYKILD